MSLLGFASIVGFLGALQGLVLAGAIMSLRGETPRPNRALALVLVLFSGSVGAVVADHAGFAEGTVWLILIEYTLSLAFPPALWAYATEVLGAKPRNRPWLHAIPLYLWLAYLLAYTIGAFGENAPEWRWLPPILGLILYMASYTVAVGIRYLKLAAGGTPLVLHLRALRGLLLSLLIVHTAQLARFLFNDVQQLENLVPVTGTVIVYVVSIVAFRQSLLFSGHETSSDQTKYQSSTLTPEQGRAIEEALVRAMDRDRPFQNENLNLSEMAARLEVPRAHLSQVVNERLGKSFTEFLNEYRVRDAVRLLGDRTVDHLTIEAIGYEVGFRSRSGFYGAYKRIVGETPAQTRGRS